ncbi:MAG: hypothetical protein EZS28_042311, partial [Streblomastix strix]
MLSQISLSQIANSIKYNYAWEDFDINCDYNIETGNKEYKFYSEKWKKKVEQYLQQDIKTGRDTTNNVTANDIDYFNDLIPNKCCYYNAKFTNVNKPTLERSDNSIAHTKDNYYCHFIIDDIEEIVLFTKHTVFKSFVEVMAERRQQALREGHQAKQLYFKNIVNSSYGADGQNNEKFDKNESIFTQDNSKFWYLCFIYFFLYKCIDMDRVHFCCMDTNSMYRAISGLTIEG